MDKNYIQTILDVPWVKKERNEIIKANLLFEEIGKENIALFMKYLLSNLTKEEKVKLIYDINSIIYTKKDEILAESDLYIENKKDIKDIIKYREEIENVRELIKT